MGENANIICLGLMLDLKLKLFLIIGVRETLNLAVANRIVGPPKVNHDPDPKIRDAQNVFLLFIIYRYLRPKINFMLPDKRWGTLFTDHFAKSVF